MLALSARGVVSVDRGASKHKPAFHCAADFCVARKHRGTANERPKPKPKPKPKNKLKTPIQHNAVAAARRFEHRESKFGDVVTAEVCPAAHAGTSTKDTDPAPPHKGPVPAASPLAHGCGHCARPPSAGSLCSADEGAARGRGRGGAPVVGGEHSRKARLQSAAGQDGESSREEARRLGTVGSDARDGPIPTTSVGPRRGRANAHSRDDLASQRCGTA